MTFDDCCCVFKIVLLFVITFFLFTNYNKNQGFDGGPQSVTGAMSNGSFNYGSASADLVAFDMPTSPGNSQTSRNRFSGAGPEYYPMADETYLNKYLYGMDPGSMSLAAVNGIEAPIFQRLNTPGTSGYMGMGNNGVYQMTNDLLVAKNLGSGQCASGRWVGDTTACPEVIAQSSPGPESFAGWSPNPHS